MGLADMADNLQRSGPF